MQIKRSIIIEAVEQGIAAARLADGQAAKLRHVAATTKKLGANFSDTPGCVWTQAFGEPNGACIMRGDDSCETFAYAYDDALNTAVAGSAFEGADFWLRAGREGLDVVA